MTVISDAVLPLKQDAINRAEQEAIIIINRVSKDLQAAGWDRNTVAPYPRSFNSSKEEFQMKLATYKLNCFLTEPDTNHPSYSCVHRLGDPVYVIMSKEGIDRFIENAKADAAFQYDCFVSKLESKIEQAVSATLDGNHVWSTSYLHVVKENGSGEMWKTQTIINTSKLGKLFNQFPTRKVKHK